MGAKCAIAVTSNAPKFAQLNWHIVGSDSCTGEQVLFFVHREVSSDAFEGIPAHLITAPALLHWKI